ncbi:MAG: hypothetical protein JXR96_01165 [Deltaproteobacteria bacterium]|nr:hypothetical protein [Deltaproteobacteria bacterium]
MAIVLLALEGSLCRVLHLESLRPDLSLVLVVFTSFHLGAGGLVLVLGLGLIADGFAGTPPGLFTSVYIVVWSAVRGSMRFVIPGIRSVQMITIFLASVFSYLLVALMYFALDLGQGPIAILLTWMLPLALANVLLALPVWALARRVLGPLASGPGH